jgi:hypothetical protein
MSDSEQSSKSGATRAPSGAPLDRPSAADIDESRMADHPD